MEFKHTIEALHSQAREIEDIMSRLEKLNDIPTIEIDLILEKLRNIYDLSSDLRSAIQKERPSIETESKATQTPEPEAEKGDTYKEELKSAKPAKEIVREKIEKEMAAKDSDDNKSKADAQFVSDRFKSSKPTLNEEISEKSKFDDVSAQYKTTPIGSIKTSLGLNEKFELINHLFEGNKEKFEKTLEVLEMAGSFVEAYNYLEAHFTWDMDDPYVQRILELIRRKLIVRRNE